MQRDAAVNWFSANCPAPEVRTRLVRVLDETIRAGTNCSFVIGQAVTARRKPFLLHWLAGEFFVFQLSPRQAKRLGVDPVAIQQTRARWPDRAGVASPGTISLERFELVQPAIEAVDRPIAVRARYRVPGTVPERVALRMDFTLAGKTVTAYAHPQDPLLPEGDMEAQFQLPSSTQLAPVVGVFVRYCTVPEPGVSNGTPLSNTVAALLEIGSGDAGPRSHNGEAPAAPAQAPQSAGFTGAFAYVGPNGNWQKVPRPHPLSWDPSELRTAFQKALADRAPGFHKSVRLPPHAPVDVEWVGMSKTTGIAFWRRESGISAVSVMLGGKESAQELAALHQTICGRGLPLPAGAWHIVQGEPKRPVFVAFHFDIRGVGDPVLGAVAPVLAAAFFAAMPGE
jgi:hypothetical protein